MLRRVVVGIVAAGCLAASPAAAASLSERGVAALDRAVLAADALRAPHTPAQLLRETAAIQGDVNAVAASGPTAAAKLLSDQGPTNPAVEMALLNAYPVTLRSGTDAGSSTTGDPLVRLAASARAHPALRASAAGCFGAGDSVWNQATWGPWGKSGHVRIISNGWCGNGRRISWFGGFRFKPWLFDGMCWANYETNGGSWLRFWSWTHGGVWAEIGVGIHGLCVGNPISGQAAATLREAANGYWDRRY